MRLVGTAIWLWALLWAPEAGYAQRARPVAKPAVVQPTRAQPAAARRTARAPRAFPKFIGQGWFSKVYQSTDGKFVIKKIKPRIGDVKRVSVARRGALARRTVRASEMLRKSGLPIPASFIPEGHGTIIVQSKVRGRSYKGLSGPAKANADKGIQRSVRKAKRLARKHKATTWYIDENVSNFRFDKAGNITHWIDPVVPIKGAEAWTIVDRRFAQGL